jgi:hypothetical protein
MTLLVCGWDEGLLRRLLARHADLVLVIDAEEQTIATVAELTPGLRRLHVVSSFDQLPDLSAVAVSEQLAGTAFDDVVGATEPAQLATGYLAGLLAGDQTALTRSVLLRDKRAMKERLREAGMPVARQITVASGADITARIDQIEQQLGWPAVVKPVAGTASIDTAVLTDRLQAQAYLSAADPLTTLMAEQYITGVELHVDAVWDGGQPLVFGVSRYVVPRVEVRESGRNNGSALLPEPGYRELYEKVMRLHRDVNEALGIDTAITHLEVFLDPHGQVWFSEVAGRVGGGGINRVFEAADVDLRESFADVLTHRGATGETRYPQQLVGWVNLAPERPGRIATVPDLDALAEPYVLRVQKCVADGEDTGQLSTTSWVCLAVLAAESWDQYLERVRALEIRGSELMRSA